MKALLLISVLITVSAAAPIQDNSQAEINQLNNTNDGKGNYEFSFETSNGIRRSESGTLVNEGQPDEHLNVQGFYSYTDPDGKIIEIYYTADEHGYNIITLVPQIIASAPLSPSVVATLLGG